ncbi:MAG: hypothetical protein K2G11_01450 [Muribaculaceae bacterium]|nr:hypothetical protein [Muribaculaceae bacterium]
MGLIPQNIINTLNSLSTEEVAERLGLGPVVRHKCSCFMHTDRHPSLCFLGKNRQDWWCFPCGKGGKGPISLVMRKEGVGFVRACEILGQLFGIYWNNNHYRTYSKPKSILPFSSASEKIETGFFASEICQWIVDHAILSSEAKVFLYEQRKLRKDITEQLRIGSITDSRKLLAALKTQFPDNKLKESGLIKEETGNLKIFTPCLIFPFYDMLGNLIALQSRYLAKSSNSTRFLFLSHFNKRLFNLPIINRLSKGDILYIAEGVTDCMALLSAGLNAVAIPSAHLIPELDILRLKGYKLKMYHDKDNPGRTSYYQIESLCISNGISIEKLDVPGGFKDYGEYFANENQLKNCYE